MLRRPKPSFHAEWRSEPAPHANCRPELAPGWSAWRLGELDLDQSCIGTRLLLDRLQVRLASLT